MRGVARNEAARQAGLYEKTWFTVLTWLALPELSKSCDLTTFALSGRSLAAACRPQEMFQK